MDHGDSLDPPNNVDVAFDRVEDCIRGMQNFFVWLSKAINFQSRQMMAKKFIHDHPNLCVFIGVSMAMCAVPIFCFFVFAVTTASFLFLGFIIVEGTILAFAFLVLLGTVLVVMCISIVCSAIILTLYYAAVSVYQLSAGMRQALVPENLDSHHTD